MGPLVADDGDVRVILPWLSARGVDCHLVVTILVYFNRQVHSFVLVVDINFSWDLHGEWILRLDEVLSKVVLSRELCVVVVAHGCWLEVRP